MAWEAIWQGDGEARAGIVAGGLAARGIRARTHGTGRLPMALPGAFAHDTRLVMVRHKDARRARAHLRSTGEAANVIGDPEEDGALDSGQRATLWFVAFGLLAVVGVVLYILLRAAIGGGA